MMNKIYGVTAIAAIAASVACLALAGCGGGGGGGSSGGGTSMTSGVGGSTSGTGGSTGTAGTTGTSNGSDTGSGGSSGTSGGSSPVTAADFVDQFKGSYATNCVLDKAVVDTATGGAIYSKYAISMLLKLTSTKLAIQMVVKFYDTADCSGTERYSVSRQSANDFMQIDGTTTVNGIAVAKATSGFGGFFANANGSPIQAGGLTLGGTYSAPPVAIRNLAYLDANGNFFSGDTNGVLDADKYPTVLNTTPDATRTN